MSDPLPATAMAVRAYQSRYVGLDNYKKPKGQFVERIAAMSDDELFEATRNGIWLSAYAGNNPRSDYHWQADVYYDEWKHREKSDEYDRAHKAAMRMAGH